jgi:hypothetical protein
MMSGLSPPTLLLPSRPIGIGASIHCSLASHITDCSFSALQNSNNAAWKAATDGRRRILRLLVTCPGLPFQWEYIGVYQHVAKTANRTARTLLLQDTLGTVLTAARAEGKRAALLRDFNTAPPGGRWGYANGSRVVQEDRTMEDWMLANYLADLLPGLLSKPTWRPSEGPQLVVLEDF